jgi:hypothetical protein
VSFQLAVDRGRASWKLTPLVSRTATDNFFWLAPGERRGLQVEVLWREPDRRDQAALVVSAWNAERQELRITK